VEKEVNGVREVGRLEGGGRRFPKKIRVRGGAKKNIIKKKTVTERKKCKRPKKARKKKTYKMRKKNEKKKKVQKEKKNDADQVGDSFIPEREFLDGALVGAGSLRPLKRENVGRQF